MDQAYFPWRPLGLLLVEKGLLTATDLELALAEQGRTGRLLGQILVGNGYVSGLALTQALAAQHGVELRLTSAAEETLAATPEHPESGRSGEPLELASRQRAWRPLGKLLVAKGFLSEAELDQALAEQEERPDRRLGEILVARGFLSGPELALALAEQHGVDLGPAKELDARLETVIRSSAAGEPSYRVHEVVYEPTYQTGTVLFESTNFLEAADFACELVERQSPEALEIQKTDGNARETVWTYSQSRAEEEAASRKSLVQTFGFDPTRWDTRGRFDTDTRAK